MTDAPGIRALRLAWDAPAAHWTQATPIGNGAIGGMVFGDARGRIALNDSTAWSGTPDGPARALRGVLAAGAGPERLAEVRAAVARHDDEAVERLLRTFEGPWSQEFLALGSLELDLGRIEPSGYERVLDLTTAVVEETFAAGQAHVTRRSWASAPDDALLVQIDADSPLDLVARLDSPLRMSAAAFAGAELGFVAELPVDGAPRHEPEAVAHVWDDGSAARRGYDPVVAVAAALCSDGDITTTPTGEVRVGAARHLFLALTTETNARRWWQGRPVRSREVLAARASSRATDLADRSPGLLRRRHEADVASALDSSRLEIGDPLPGRIDVAELLRERDDRALASVLYAYGRYLLLSSSRAGSPPANLQGIWNASMRPAWSSNYTVNINTQMNYWLAERTGLGEAHRPLLDLVARLATTGSAVARELYGARGWVVHHNTDPWGYALAAGAGHGGTSWAFWPMGGLWLADHLWQRWEYGRDRLELEHEVLPILLGAGAFALDWLVPAAGGMLGTSPSTSPESSFVRADGTTGSVSTSSAMDVTLIGATLRRTLLAAEIVGGDALRNPLLEEIRAALPRLARPTLDDGGAIREWGDDAHPADPHHRHLSPLIGLFPLAEIDIERTPALAAGARRLLDSRGPGAMGWSWAWKIALRARLGDGDAARELLREATHPFDGDPGADAPVDGSRWGGLLPNLFSTHPPFQLDGNYGFTAGIAEMLIGSGVGAEGDPLRLLPALPAAWPRGSVSGIRTRGGLAVDLVWHDGAPRLLTLRDATGAAPSEVLVSFAGRRRFLPVDGLPREVSGLFATASGSGAGGEAADEAVDEADSERAGVR